MTYLSISKACKYLGQNRQFVEALIHSGKLKFIRVKSRILTRKDWLDGIEPDNNNEVRINGTPVKLLNENEMKDYYRNSKDKWLKAVKN